MDLTFLGTGGAWGLPELDCDCIICREMRQRHEKRTRTSLFISGKTNILIDCGPDAKSQLEEQGIDRVDAVLITHEHGDHYMGLDELFAYKRNAPRGHFHPIPLYATPRSWEVMGQRFNYLADMEVIRVHPVEPGISISLGEIDILPFKTSHGAFAAGSVGYILSGHGSRGRVLRLAYTSDFDGLPETPHSLLSLDYLVIQSFWLNEPRRNTPHHMSFQRALDFIETWNPTKETFLVHIGDGDPIPGDRANSMLKKRPPIDPLKTPDGTPYPIPRHQKEWDAVVARILKDRGSRYRVRVAHDGMRLQL